MMNSWKQLLKESIVRPADLVKRFGVDPRPLEAVAARYPMRVNPYYLSLIQSVDDPIWRQAVPSVDELQAGSCVADPLDEESQSPVPNLVHRYPDRVLFIVSSECAMYCRFCTRKRKVGCAQMRITRETIQQGLDYIRNHPEVRDVILSGGDPLLLPDETLEWILKELRAIPTVEIIRIGSRVPVVLPQRITPHLTRMLKKYHPLYLNTHFNHPLEITPEATEACARLADAGIPLGNQSVLLRGVNDNVETMKRLVQKLLSIRVKPYYLYQADLVEGTDHFRTTVEEGIAIIDGLRGFTSGMGVPSFVIDAPGGGGKIPLLPDYVQQMGDQVVLRNYQHRRFVYPNGKPAPEALPLEENQERIAG
jgi:lysine 2,3-aminomutase